MTRGYKKKVGVVNPNNSSCNLEHVFHAFTINTCERECAGFNFP